MSLVLVLKLRLDEQVDDLLVVEFDVGDGHSDQHIAPALFDLVEDFGDDARDDAHAALLGKGGDRSAHREGLAAFFRTDLLPVCP